MFIGIDHGTTAMRFAGETGEFRISREQAKEFRIADLTRLCPPDEIEGIAICYSMGDNITAITDIRKVKNRGIVSRDGAGKHIGGGTRVYDEVAASGIPAVVMPGLHRGSPTDPRFKAYSHQTSPEKIGIAYEVCDCAGKRCHCFRCQLEYRFAPCFRRKTGRCIRCLHLCTRHPSRGA